MSTTFCNLFFFFFRSKIVSSFFVVDFFSVVLNRWLVGGSDEIEIRVSHNHQAVVRMD